MKRHIALIGARAAGKSKLSRKLGKLSGRTVLSTDTIVSYEAGGKSIATIVAAEGWSGFRQREYDVLQKITSMENLLIDCGGGIIVEATTAEGEEETLSERKIALLKEHCEIFYIKRGVEWLLKRAAEGANSSRPDLGGEYLKTLQRRLPWYESIADHTIQVGKSDIDDLAVQLLVGFPDLFRSQGE